MLHFSGAGASFCSKNNPKGLYEQEKLHLNNVDFLAFPIFFEIHCFVSVVIVSLIRMIFFGFFPFFSHGLNLKKIYYE